MSTIKTAIQAENSEFILEWKDKMYKALKRARPEVDEDKLVEFIDRKFREKFKNPRTFIYNNIKMKSLEEAQQKYTMGLLEIIEFIRAKNPILTESGVMFKQHKDQINPAAKVLWKWKGQRKSLQRQSMVFYESGDMGRFGTLDLQQTGKKINMNSYYGASGLKTSVMYNLHVAESITLKGQRIISSSATAMDG
ncbi:MAG: DNA polymerase domain-containing protein, partial [Cetobacterium sp.]|uniref:DNA polymerase domain-containing protein n=1 Tax=Cetobacterium sp. TaxID=2071632 RepID=UPI003F32662E